MLKGKVHTIQDSLLLIQLSEGNRPAFEALYEKYWDQVFNEAYKRIGHRDQAKDIAQEVFTSLWMRSAEIPIKNLPAWLYVVTKNNVYRTMHQQERFVPMDDILSELESYNGLPDAVLIEKELLRAHEALIENLPEQQRVIFRMRYQEELSPGEIAMKLNLSPKTIRNHIGRALVKLKTALMLLLLLFLISLSAVAQKQDMASEVRKTMLDATRFMVEEVSTNGGYVSHYLPDFSRRWAEQEAYPSQIMLTYETTPRMGHVFLDAYNATGNEYYYQAAEKVARALIWGQHPAGGWDYIIDFAGTASLQNWFNTIGKNAWGWDEYNHYYGVPTFKNGATVGAARFLLRIYLEKLDPQLKPALDKAISFFIESQYPLGGWPQRYPLKHSFPRGEFEDYTSFYTFNDDLSWENTEFLIDCYITLGEERFIDPIRRGMNFSLITQQGNPQGGWAEQYNMDIRPAHGRQYEPVALMPGQTVRQIGLLMLFYRYTGDRRFLARIPDAFRWLESARLPVGMAENGKYTHPVFVEIGTNKPLFAHRKGTGIPDGRYWVDYEDDNPLLHYGAKANLDKTISKLKEDYAQLLTISPADVIKNSPLKDPGFHGGRRPQDYFDLDGRKRGEIPKDDEIYAIIKSLDNRHRWLTRNEWITRPYSVSASGEESNTAPLSTEGGSQIRDMTDQQYISTRKYMANMNLLISYIVSRSQTGSR